jgi:hypothetical protein
MIKCLDDFHTYEFENRHSEHELDVQAHYDKPGQIHFYEVRQDGTRINGTTNEEVLEVLIHRLGKLNQKVSCPENRMAIDYLEVALSYLRARTKDRIGRHVEGTQKP